MSKKFAVLAAACGRPFAFTVADLAERAGVSTSTVQTVLNRAPEDWFTRTQVPSGVRGGQPVAYTLTEGGRRAIEHTLEKANVMPRLAPEQPPLEIPLGLLSAQATLREMDAAPPAARNGLREDALGNLAWAASELRDGLFGTSTDDLLKQIAKLRERLGDDATLTSHRASPVAPDAEPLEATKSESFVRIATRQLTYWGNALARRGASRPAAARERPVTVVIGYLDANEGSRDLATFARGALAGACQCARIERAGNLHVVMHPWGAERAWGGFHDAWPHDIEEASEFLLCINSSTNAVQVRHALKALKEGKMPKVAVVLDEGFSPQVEAIAHELEIAYEGNATKPGFMAWIDHAIGGA